MCREAFILFVQSLYLLLLIYRLAVIPSMHSSFTIGVMVAYVAAVYTGVNSVHENCTLLLFLMYVRAGVLTEIKV